MKNVKGKLKSLMALVLSFTILSGTVVTPAETLEPREIGEDTILSEEFQQQLEELAQTPQITSSELVLLNIEINMEMKIGLGKNRMIWIRRAILLEKG